MTMFVTYTMFMVLSYVHQSVQSGRVTQITSALYKTIEVEKPSWMEASLNETHTFLTDSRKGYVALMV